MVSAILVFWNLRFIIHNSCKVVPLDAANQGAPSLCTHRPSRRLYAR
jgi:hypothetical protein